MLRAPERHREGESEGERNRGKKMEGTQPAHATIPWTLPERDPLHNTVRAWCHPPHHRPGNRAYVRVFVCWGGIKKSTFQQLNTNRRVWKRAKRKTKKKRRKESKHEKITMRWWLGFFAVIIVVLGVQSQYKEERLTSVFNVCISLPPSLSLSPPPLLPL